MRVDAAGQQAGKNSVPFQADQRRTIGDMPEAHAVTFRHPARGQGRFGEVSEGCERLIVFQAFRAGRPPFAGKGVPAGCQTIFGPQEAYQGIADIFYWRCFGVFGR